MVGTHLEVLSCSMQEYGPKLKQLKQVWESNLTFLFVIGEGIDSHAARDHGQHSLSSLLISFLLRNQD